MNASGADSGNAASGNLSEPYYLSGQYLFVPGDQKVVFVSSASNLVSNDTNGLPDVFVQDLATGVTTLISSNAGGTASSNGKSQDPAVSPDGSKIAFTSTGSDFGPTDTNGLEDIYLYDLGTGTTSLVSTKAGGTNSGNRESFVPVFSPDGHKLIFISRANDLGPHDTNVCLGVPVNTSCPDLYVRDLLVGTTSLVSVGGTGTDSGNKGSFQGEFSPDGTKVVFWSSASNLGPTDTNGTEDLYLRDLTAGTTSLVSVNALGTDSPNGQSSGPTFSPDGTKLAFNSTASNFGPTDTNATGDVYLRDLTAGTTRLVSVNATLSDAGNAESSGPRFSSDGQKVVFTSVASTLGAVDTNSKDDVYVRDLVTGTRTLVSANSAGADSGNDASSEPLFSPDGSHIAFTSSATNLGPFDDNKTCPGYTIPGPFRQCSQLYERDLTAAKTSLVSSNVARNNGGNDHSAGGRHSTDGKTILFSSRASNLSGGTDTNGTWDIYLASHVPPS